ncbi:MAG: VWA domain-containing protein [Pyrinomonadaceae bacterium]
MSSSIKIVLLIFFLFAATNAQTPAPIPVPDDTPERVFTEEIKLNVSAVDGDGKFVSDVKKEDLVINEDGRLNQASSLRRVPANVLIVMDTGGEMRAAKNFKDTVDAAKSLINALAPQDSVAIMQYNDKVEIIAEWTNDKAEALKILQTKSNFGRRSMFTNAIETATKFLQKTPLDNRHLVLITDGTDSFSNLSERDAAMKNLLATDVNVHVLSYTKMELTNIEPRAKGISNSPPPKAMPDEVKATLPRGIQDMLNAPTIKTINTDRKFLKKMRERKNALLESQKYLDALANDTNGEFILPESNEEMLAKTALVAGTIDSSYVLTYIPKRPLAESKTGEIRNIEITSRRSDLIVQARRKLIVENK